MASYKMLSGWYSQLADHVSAGITLPEAIEYCEGPPLKGRRKLSALLSTDLSAEMALEKAPPWLPHSDRIFIAAAVECGRVPEILKRLAEQYEVRSKNLTKVYFALIYPLTLYHIAALVAPILEMIDFQEGFIWNTNSYLYELLFWIVPLWLLLILLPIILKRNSPIIRALVTLLPVLNSYRKHQAIANFSFALSYLYEAGIHIQDAWLRASHVAQDKAIDKASKLAILAIKSGQDPLTALYANKTLPESFLGFYKTGANTGNLDTNLFKAGMNYQMLANQKATIAAIIYPSLLLLIIAAWVISLIFSLFGSYLSAFEQFL